MYSAAVYYMLYLNSQFVSQILTYIVQSKTKDRHTYM